MYVVKELDKRATAKISEGQSTKQRKERQVQ